MAVYAAARDLAGVPVGTHQFIIVVNESNPYPPARLGDVAVAARTLGGGKTGFVVGAHNRERKAPKAGNFLVVEYFEKSDYQAALEYFDPSLVKWYKSDFDTEVSPVDFGQAGEQAGVRRLFMLINNFYLTQEVDPIPYPRAGWGYNSNSWAQTVLELAGGKVSSSDMSGLDIANEKRIPAIYFEDICPVQPRPKLN